MTITLNALQKQRRDTASNWTSNNTVLLAGEWGIESDTKKFKIGDGTTAWQSLDYVPIPDTNRLLTGNLTVGGNFTVNGTTTTIDTTTLTVEDKNIEIGKVSTPTDTTADGGGITLKGATDKTINWVDSTDSWTLSEHLDLASGKVLKVAGTEILSATTLGSSVVSSSLTSVGTITTGTWNATAISGSKVTPDFGSQNIATTGSLGLGATPATGYQLQVTGQSGYDDLVRLTGVGTNIGPRINLTPTGTGVGRLNATSNSLQLQTGGNTALTIDTSQQVGIGTTSPIAKLNVNSGSTDLAAQLVSSDTNVFLAFKDGDASGNQQVQIGGEGNNLVAYAGGLERMRIDSDGKVLISTNTNGTSDVLTLHADADGTNNGIASIKFTGNTGNHAAFIKGGHTTNGDTILTFHTDAHASGINPEERMRIDSTGNVGIGTTSPDQKLHLAASGNGAFIRFENTDTTVSAAQTFGGLEFESRDTSSGSAGVISKIDCISSAAFDGSSANGGELRFHTSGTNSISLQERIRIDAIGNVGIGTSNPSNKVEIVGGTGVNVLLNAATHDASTANQARLQLGYVHSGGQALGHIKLDEAAPNDFSGIFRIGVPYNNQSGGSSTREVVEVDFNGNLCLPGSTTVFTSNPRTSGLQLHYESDSGIATIASYSSGGSTQLNIGTNNNAGNVSTAMTINTSGNVGIGQTAPQSILEVRKSDNRTWDYNTVHSAIANYTAEDHELKIYNPDTNVGSYAGLFLAVASTGLNTARIAAIKRDLGATDLGFAVRQGGTGYLFKERLRILSSGGITFNGDTATSNALDDYEEGTFTPTITYETSDDGNKAYDIQAGGYTKIGRAVHCNIALSYSNRGTGSGRLRINGLPHDVGDILSSTIFEASGTVGYFAGLISSVSDIKAIGIQGTDQVQLYGVLGTHSTSTGDFTYAHIGNSFSIRVSITYLTA